ncbi:MAG: hypothetical protein IJF83_08175 [Methanobrevibacter sp.]|jgi:hypothetical protein|nr:hypothetical protein [Methanobrevibacter sp.]MBR0371726.1 hypothetical protein [Methanobrevibacter sp.]
MDKILETLSQKFSAEELNEVKKAIEFTVDEKVKAKSEQEAKMIAKKADEFCQKKIKEAVEKKTAEIEEIANKFCEERCEKLSKEADAKVESYKKKLEEASEQYILEYFDEKFTEKYGQELEAIEEKVITGLDKYLEYNINEKIGPEMIQKTALQETCQPIVEEFIHILEDRYVAPNTTGSKRIRELKAENAEVRASLQKQLDENMRLAELVESTGKKSLISEKVADLSADQRLKVRKFFKEKSLNETKKDIDAYIEMIQEQADSINAMRYEREQLFESHEKPVRKSRYVEDRTNETITEKFKPKRRELSARERMMLGSANLIDEN